MPTKPWDDVNETENERSCQCDNYIQLAAVPWDNSITYTTAL